MSRRGLSEAVQWGAGDRSDIIGRGVASVGSRPLQRAFLESWFPLLSA